MDFTYRKTENASLEDSWGVLNLQQPQSYIPIYNTFFALNTTNFQKTTLNQRYTLDKIESKLSSNIYECSVNGVRQHVFFKESPLLDTVKYLTGKYDVADEGLFRLPSLENECHPKIKDPNNASYVDGFFAYLSSELLHKHQFLHGLDFYGSFLGIKEDYFIDIGEDIDILSESDFFHRENGTLFCLESGVEICGDTRKNRPPLALSPTVRSTDGMVNISSSEELGALCESPANAEPFEIEMIFESPCGKEGDEGSRCRSPNDSNSDHGSRSDNDSESEDDSESDDESDNDGELDNDDERDNDGESDSGSEFSSEEEESVFVTIPKYPIQAIALEKCTDTLDHLMLRNDLDDEELGSMVFQIVMTLITYQKAFDFTHNDLHTSNIMYKETDKTFLCYKYGERYYRVPTFGRIFKIIDFGRAIYKFRGKRLCSDSYHPEGDAATQYNCEPYYNEFKPTIEPNPSFDLCRLGCALFDLLIDDMDKIDKESDVVKLIVSWCYDDKGRNILYKKSGAERYPDFKLYKMIARTVHGCVPHEVFRNEFFERYLTSKKKLKQQKYLNVDEIPDYREKNNLL